MLSVSTAAFLRRHGPAWSPTPGDRFVIADRGMDDEVFVLSEMTIEAHHYPTGTVLGFNGTTEWALDSVAVEGALWLPREDQLRVRLGAGFLGLRQGPAGFEVGTVDGEGRPCWTAARDAEEAYAQAVLAREAPDQPVALLPAACEGVGWRVRAAPDRVWGRAADAGGRTARQLLTELVRTQLRTADVLQGKAWEATGGRAGSDVLGADPVTAWEEATRTALHAWARVADPRTPVHTGDGIATAGAYAEEVLAELVAGAWDLARATGLDDRLDDRVVGYLVERSAGGAGVEPGDRQRQLLERLGRAEVSSST